MPKTRRKKSRFASPMLFLPMILFPLSLFAGRQVVMYYRWDPLTDDYIYTNIKDSKDCKPLYTRRGPVRHSRGFHFSARKERAFDHFITHASQQFGLDFYLIKSVIKAESLFDERAVSKAGAKGLMQLMPATAQQMGVKNLFDPEQNIMAGARYLKKMLTRFNKHRLALAAYNAGPAAVHFYNGVPPYSETQNYVQKINNYYYQYTGKYLW